MICLIGRYILWHTYTHITHSHLAPPKVNLFREITREIDDLSPGRSAFPHVSSSSAKAPKDSSDPDELMDWLDKREFISFKWTDVKQLITRASNLDAELTRGKADD